MYEGAPDYPDKDIWWELCERYGVTIFYTAPTAIRACIKWGAEYPGRHDLSSIRLLGTVGEPINPKAWLWYWKVIGGGRAPIVDTWWQTETGRIMITTLPGRAGGEARLGGQAAAGDRGGGASTTRANEIGGEQGLLTLRRPWPGMLRTLYRDDDRYVETYFSKFGPETYFVGDASREDSDGYFWVIGRVDDVINVSGHRLSTAEVESAIVSHPKVAECAVIGQADEDTGQSICAFVTLEGDLEGGDELIAEINEQVAQPDRQVRPPEADRLGRRPAEDPLREDHAPAAARHRRGPRARRRDHAARPRRRQGARRDRQAPRERGRGGVGNRSAFGDRRAGWKRSGR